MTKITLRRVVDTVERLRGPRGGGVRLKDVLEAINGVTRSAVRDLLKEAVDTGKLEKRGYRFGIAKYTSYNNTRGSKSKDKPQVSRRRNSACTYQRKTTGGMSSSRVRRTLGGRRSNSFYSQRRTIPSRRTSRRRNVTSTYQRRTTGIKDLSSSCVRRTLGGRKSNFSHGQRRMNPSRRTSRRRNPKSSPRQRILGRKTNSSSGCRNHARRKRSPSGSNHVLATQESRAVHFSKAVTNLIQNCPSCLRKARSRTSVPSSASREEDVPVNSGSRLCSTRDSLELIRERFPNMISQDTLPPPLYCGSPSHLSDTATPSTSGRASQAIEESAPSTSRGAFNNTDETIPTTSQYAPSIHTVPTQAFASI